MATNHGKLLNQNLKIQKYRSKKIPLFEKIRFSNFHISEFFSENYKNFIKKIEHRYPHVFLLKLSVVLGKALAPASARLRFRSGAGAGAKMSEGPETERSPELFA